MPKLSKGTIHAQRLKAIRPYISFDFNLNRPLSDSAKRKIKRYYDEIHALTARPFQVYRPRIKSRLKKAQQFAQHEHKLRDLKVALIPVGSEKVRIKTNSKGEIYTVSQYVTTTQIPFDPKKLVIDPKGYVTRLIKDEEKGIQYTIQAGPYEIPNPVSKTQAPEKIARLTMKYGDKDKNNYFGNWLHGLNKHKFKNQQSKFDYVKSRDAAKQKHKAAKKKRAKNARNMGSR